MPDTMELKDQHDHEDRDPDGDDDEKISLRESASTGIGSRDHVLIAEVQLGCRVRRLIRRLSFTFD
ncbi:MAG: hypothetical protein ACOC5U_04520 [Candidatus Aminicenantaceae bacterium]